MAREQWAKVDVDMPTDEKLFGRPVLERHLWTCLICLSKKNKIETDDFTIYNLDAAALSKRFNLGSPSGVERGLKYFEGCRPRPMIRRKDGAIVLLNIEKRQESTKDTPEAHRARQARYRERMRDGGGDGGRDGPSDGPAPPSPPRHEVSPRDADQDQDQEGDHVSDPRVDPVARARADWPQDLLTRVRDACGKSDLDRDYQLFVGRTLRMPREKRVAAGTEFLEGNYAAKVNDALSYCEGMIKKSTGVRRDAGNGAPELGEQSYGERMKAKGRAVIAEREQERREAAKHPRVRNGKH